MHMHMHTVLAKRTRFHRQDVKSSVTMETPRTLDVMEFAQVTVCACGCACVMCMYVHVYGCACACVMRCHVSCSCITCIIFDMICPYPGPCHRTLLVASHAHLPLRWQSSSLPNPPTSPPPSRHVTQRTSHAMAHACCCETGDGEDGTEYAETAYTTYQ